MSDALVTVRPGVSADAEAGARCHVACWREAYGDLVDPAVLVKRTGDLAQRTSRWRDILAGATLRWVAVTESGEVVGFAQAGPPRDDPVRPLELYALYVRTARYGTGLGDRLLAAAIGDRPAYLWVLAANERAIRFYARHGFVLDGSGKPEPMFAANELRMRRG